MVDVEMPAKPRDSDEPAAFREERVRNENTMGWTLATLREDILALVKANDQRYEERFQQTQVALTAAFVAQKDAVAAAFSAQKDAVNQALMAADRAVSKAEIASEKRFDAVNEFRSTLADQQRTLMPRNEVEVILKSFADKLDALSKRIAETAATSNERISQVSQQISERKAETTGTQTGWGYAVGVIGIVLAIVSIVAVSVTLLKK